MPTWAGLQRMKGILGYLHHDTYMAPESFLMLRRKDLMSVDQMALGVMAVEEFPAFPPFTVSFY